MFIAENCIIHELHVFNALEALEVYTVQVLMFDSDISVINDVCRGFKDARTAELLLQRSRKLEHSSVQKKKFSQLGQYFLTVVDFVAVVILWKADAVVMPLMEQTL